MQDTHTHTDARASQATMHAMTHDDADSAEHAGRELQSRAHSLQLAEVLCLHCRKHGPLSSVAACAVAHGSDVRGESVLCVLCV